MAIDLAVATDGPTRRRLHHHLPAHGIAVHYLEVGSGITELHAGADDSRSFDVGFVYPSRIVEGDVVTATLELPWVNGRDAILTTRNKAGSLARLAREGIAIPRTVHVSSPVESAAVTDAFDVFDGPVVVKPNTTTKGIGHVLVHDVDSLRGVADYLDLIHSFPATRDRSYLLQAYLPDARDLRLTLIDGSVAAAVERRLPAASDGRWVRNVHRGAEAVSVEPPARAVELAERAADCLGVAFLGVDMLLDGDAAYVLEVNGRPTIDREEKYPSDFYERLASLIKRVARD